MGNYLFLSTKTFAKGDTGTPLKIEVGDENGPWDLTGATVEFDYFDKLSSDRFSKGMTPDADQVNKRGQAIAYWGADQFASLSAQNFQSQARVHFPGGTVRLSPSEGSVIFTIQESMLSTVVTQPPGETGGGGGGTTVQWLYGTGDPSPDLGVPGQSYLDQTPGAERLFMKKEDGTWFEMAGAS